MSGVFRVLTRLKQRFTGQLMKELHLRAQHEKSRRLILRRIVEERIAFKRKLQTDIERLNATHDAQRQRDKEYFERLARRRKAETASEAGSKSFRHAARSDKTQEPQVHLKAEILERQRNARTDGSADSAIRVGKSLGLKKSPPDRPADAPTTPAEAVQQAMAAKSKLYSRKRTKEHGRGIDRDKTRNENHVRDDLRAAEITVQFE